MGAERLEAASANYDAAEAAFLTAVRSGTERGGLAAAARTVANAAKEFNSEAYRKLHAGEEDAWMPLDQLTERTEVLAELWTDLPSAYAT